jgi:alpha-D-ribose 1-methylphosphonate 5-triphosphate synthase subunit PhnH
MNPNDIVFTSTVTDRDLTITLKEGTPTTFGKQHIITKRANMANKIHVVKYTVENADFAIIDEGHQEREQMYCFGADSTHPDLYMMVIVEYEDDKKGTIITALPKDNVPKEGVITYVNAKKIHKI